MLDFELLSDFFKLIEVAMVAGSRHGDLLASVENGN